MKTGDIPKMAFISHLDIFKFVVIPFGLCFAIVMFQAVMDNIQIKQKTEAKPKEIAAFILE
jgi:hypothetical protein